MDNLDKVNHFYQAPTGVFTDLYTQDQLEGPPSGDGDGAEWCPSAYAS